jgi:hypothetical protein
MINKELDLAFDFVQYTNQNIFLTGKAGTGKTTFLKSLKSRLMKRMVVVAPTGVAAINAGGVTIHSFFQLPFGPIITEKVAGHKIENPNFKKKFNKRKINIIRTIDLLIIDEISMVRADMLDAIDEVLRKYKNRFLPFGGVQLLMIGDLQQLAPVVKDDEWNMLRSYYNSMYFFNSKAIQESSMVTLELKHIYRQKDDVFVKVLNEVRNDKLTQESYDLLHQRYIPDFKPKEEEGYITLTTHNNSANNTNKEHLDRIKKKSKFFQAKVDGTFSEYSYPTDYDLELKVGAQVMYVKNDSSPEKRYFNGKIGKIISFDEDNIVVRCPDDTEDIYTSQELWENIKYTIDKETKEIKEEVIGSFYQYPLRLAWAITIHKSQGLTFERAIIDANAAFSHGQTYVALSRCKTMEGLVLSSRISKSAIICDREVSAFNKNVEENQPDEKQLEAAKHKYQFDLVKELFNYRQLDFWVNRLERNIEENIRSFSGNIKETAIFIRKESLPKIRGIADSFINQLIRMLAENADIENNNEVQERIRKAAEYFHKYHNDNIITKLRNSSFESDNKATKTAIKDALDNINKILEIKQNTLEICKKGFKITEYLEIKAKSTIEEEKKKVKKEITPFREIDTKYPELYSLLKFWRRETADELDVELYQVAPNKLLQAITNNLPITKNQLMALSGMGKARFKKFGKEIIEMVEEYVEDNGLEVNTDEPESKIAKKQTKIRIPKARKVPNHEKSYKLYLEGKEIPEIAKELGFVNTTIESHLARYVASGDLDVDEFVKQESIDKVIDYYKKHPETTLSDAKHELGENISYSDIRFVLKSLENKG